MRFILIWVHEFRKQRFKLRSELQCPHVNRRDRWKNGFPALYGPCHEATPVRGSSQGFTSADSEEKTAKYVFPMTRTKIHEMEDSNEL
ncbi:MAG TPA: hypothetical protein DGU45_07090 [Planctomycetes bacterium]|nr:hypothetical protein [Planctomycetota bacterium]